VQKLTRILLLLMLAALTIQGASARTKAPEKKKFLVVIDPGHGGNDSGASHEEKKDGKKIAFAEKDLTLLLARDLARELIIKGHNVILTRNDDRLIPLSDRTALANRLKADVFISIHLNSSSGQQQGSGGVETFILNHATDESSKRLADLENSVLKESSANEHSGSADVALIMKDMILDAALMPSRELACAVQNRLKVASPGTTVRDRGVKQALFYVLLGADMPSILIEAGFMNSKMDRNRVLGTQSRLKMAAQIARAIDDYRHKKTPKGCRVQSEKLYQRKEETKKTSVL
jgi:N-acetylmuramoyl-L-alanine amidase